MVDVSEFTKVENDPLDFTEVEKLEENADFPEICAASLHGKPIPAREWHVEGLIPSNNVTLLNGDGGTGKSLLSLQLACATAIGGTWIGRPVRRGTCMFITAEDEIDEVHRRQADIADDGGFTMADLNRLFITSLAGRDALLAVPNGKSNVIKETDLFERLNKRIRARKPELVVLDTLADLFGGEENQRAQARQFISLLRGLALDNRTTILMLAHPSLAGMSSGTGSSGSTGWNNSVRSRLYFKRITDGDVENDPDARLLETMKANYGRVGEQIKLRWRRGVFVTEDKSPDSFSEIAAHSKAERVFMTLLETYRAEGRHVSASPSANYAPTVFSRDGRAEGVNRASLVKAMNRLFQSQQIRVAHYGPPSKRRTCVVDATLEGEE